MMTIVFFLFKQKTAYEMRISDWSSDVCSSDLMAGIGLKNNVMTVRWVPSQPTTIQDKAFLDVAVPRAFANGVKVILAVYPYPPRELEEIGRASCRASVCQSV